jgi:hypothetical protein
MQILTPISALQKQRHDIQRQLAELHRSDVSGLNMLLRDICEEKIIHGSSNKEAATMETKQLRSRQRQSMRSIDRQRRFLACVSTPTWFLNCRRTLEICGYKAPSGWMFSLQTYNILPADFSQDMHICMEQGSISDLQRLFGERKVFPFDRLDNGLTLLDVRYSDLLHRGSRLIFPSVQRSVSNQQYANFSLIKAWTPIFLLFRKFCLSYYTLLRTL